MDRKTRNLIVMSLTACLACPGEVAASQVVNSCVAGGLAVPNPLSRTSGEGRGLSGEFTIESLTAEPVVIPVLTGKMDPKGIIDSDTYELNPDVDLNDLLQIALSFDRLVYAADIRWSLGGSGFSADYFRLQKGAQLLRETPVVLIGESVVPPSGYYADESIQPGVPVQYSGTLAGEFKSATVLMPEGYQAVLDCASGKERVESLSVNLRPELETDGERRRLGTLKLNLSKRKLRGTYVLNFTDLKTLYPNLPKKIDGVDVDQYQPDTPVYSRVFEPMNCTDFRTPTTLTEDSAQVVARPVVPGRDLEAEISWKTNSDSGSEGEFFQVRRLKLTEEDLEMDWDNASVVGQVNVNAVSSKGSTYQIQDRIPNEGRPEQFGKYAYALCHSKNAEPLSVLTAEFKEPEQSAKVDSVFPNPFSSRTQEIGIRIKGNRPMAVMTTVVDQNGREVGRHEVQEVPAGDFVDVKVPVSDLINGVQLKPGLYLLQIRVRDSYRPGDYGKPLGVWKLVYQP